MQGVRALTAPGEGQLFGLRKTRRCGAQAGSEGHADDYAEVSSLT